MYANKLFCYKKEKSISFLLGAGFSAPMKYPLGEHLNEKLLNCAGDNIAFRPDGEIYIYKDGAKPVFENRSSYDLCFDFCKDVIHYYDSNVSKFDYEEFYDYFKKQEKENDNTGLKDLFYNGQYSKNGIK